MVDDQHFDKIMREFSGNDLQKIIKNFDPAAKAFVMLGLFQIANADGIFDDIEKDFYLKVSKLLGNNRFGQSDQTFYTESSQINVPNIDLVIGDVLGDLSFEQKRWYIRTALLMMDINGERQKSEWEVWKRQIELMKLTQSEIEQIMNVAFAQ